MGNLRAGAAILTTAGGAFATRRQSPPVRGTAAFRRRTPRRAKASWERSEVVDSSTLASDLDAGTWLEFVLMEMAVLRSFAGAR
jgi:hypothetical protein